MSSPSITRKEEWDAIAEEFYAYFLSWLRTKGTSVDDIEEYNSLVGVKSLPARLELAGVRKNVLVPIKTLTSINDEAVEKANQAAQKALDASVTANTAADRANTAADNADKAREQLEDTIADVEYACQNANRAASRADEIAQHPPKIGTNNNWWFWNEWTGLYEDSNVSAHGGAFLNLVEVKDLNTLQQMANNNQLIDGTLYYIPEGTL